MGDPVGNGGISGLRKVMRLRVPHRDPSGPKSL